MQIRPFLYSAAFATTLMATSALFAPVWAQKTAVSDPATQWAVSKIDGKGEAGAYCALARKFRQNGIMTIARNENNEASFALDFPSARFKAGEKLNVTLDPGAGEQRSYDINPISNKAFVVRLGEDNKFFAALEKTGLLRVEAAGEFYNYNLADIDVGESKLSTCVAALGGGSGVGESQNYAQAGAPASGEAADAFREQITNLRRDIDNLRKENRKLLEQADSSASSPVKTADLGDRTESLQKENDELKLQLAEAKTHSTMMAKPEDDKALQELKKENEKLKTFIEAANSRQKDIAPGIEALQKKIASLELENKRFMDMATTGSGARDQAVKASQDMVSDLRKENEKLKKDLAAKAGPGNEIEDLKIRVAALQEENGRLRAKGAVPAPYPPAINPEEMAALREDNQRLQKLLDNKAANEADAAELQKQIAALQEEKTKVVSAMEELRSKTGAEQEAKVAEMQQKIDSLSSEIKDKDQKQAELAALAAEMDDLRAQQQDISKSSADTAELQKQVADLTVQADALKAQNKELQDKLASASGAQEIVASLNEKITNLEGENATLKGEIASLQQSAGKVDMAQGDIESLRKENKELLRQLEDARSRVVALSAQPSPEQRLEQKPLQKSEPPQALSEELPASDVVPARAALNTQNEAAEQESKLMAAPAQQLAIPPAASSAAVHADSAMPEIEEIENIKDISALNPSAGDEGTSAEGIDITQHDEEPAAPVQPQKEVIVETHQERLAKLEKQLREGDYSNQEDMQQIAREYMVLRQQLNGIVEPRAQQITEAQPVMQQAVTAMSDPSIAPPPPAPETPLQTEISEPMPEAGFDRYDGPTEAQFLEERQRGGEWREMVVAPASTPAAIPQTAVLPDPVQAGMEKMNAPLSAAPQIAVYNPSFSVQDVLVQASIVPQQGVEMVKGVSGSDLVAYQWHAGPVYGSAEQRPLSDAARFDDAVKSYLEKTQERCSGEFAVSPDSSQQTGETRIDSYEIACIGRGVSSSASLLFFNKAGTFTVMAHEAPASDLGAAMDIRDKVMKTISGT